MNTPARISLYLAVACALVGLTVGSITAYKAWRFDDGFEPAYLLYEDITYKDARPDEVGRRIDRQWLAWLEDSAGSAGRLFAEIQYEAVKGNRKIVPPYPVILFEYDLRLAVIGNGWVWCTSLLLLSSLLLAMPLLRFCRRRRRGSCTRCGRPLSELTQPKCPHCGCPFPVENGSSATPSRLVFSNRRQLFKSLRRVGMFFGVAILVGTLGLWFYRDYDRKQRIRTYRDALIRQDADANVVVSRIMADLDPWESLEDRRMLLGAVANPEVPTNTRTTLARALIDAWVPGTEALLMGMYESSSTDEKIRLVEALRKASSYKDVAEFLVPKFPDETDQVLRIAIANWFKANFTCRDFAEVLVGFYDREENTLVKIAIAGAVRECDDQFAETWLTELLFEHGNDADETIFEACQNALGGIH